MSRAGPGLRGIAQRRSDAWLTDFTMRPDEMRVKKRPALMALVKQFEGVCTPKLGISKWDAAEPIAYLKARTALQEADESIIALVYHSRHRAATAPTANHTHR